MLFVHIPKTGGTTIEAVLKIPKNHALAFDRFQELERPTTFTVAVVRNPWDRALSWYRFCVAGAGPPPHPVAHCTFARKLNLGLRKSPGKKSAAEANAVAEDSTHRKALRKPLGLDSHERLCDTSPHWRVSS